METPQRALVAELFIPGEPRPKARARHVRRSGRTYTYTPKSTVAQEEAVMRAFRETVPYWKTDLDSGFEVDVDCRISTRVRRDTDNLAKLVIDALNGVVWGDDTQVFSLRVRKQLVGPEDACTRVTIWRWRPNPLDRRHRRCAVCGESFSVPAASSRNYCQPGRCGKEAV